mmetsp:Transcript_27177/g.78312  ORF Transcript_27177/g.78312 Transcript_27177/m.78312 type:complete len:218 (-) Transcript_27177:375-1028(-)
MADATVLGPPPHKQDEGLRAGLHVPACLEQDRIVEGAGAVDGHIDGNCIAEKPEGRRSNERDLRLHVTECRPPELESALPDKTISACTKCRLLQLPAVQMCCRKTLCLQSALHMQPCCQVFWACGHHDVHFRHGHTKSSATEKVAAHNTNDLDIKYALKLHLHGMRQAHNNSVAVWPGRDQLQQFGHLGLETAGRECRGCHWLHALLALLRLHRCTR